jgi:hypothetical protein
MDSNEDYKRLKLSDGAVYDLIVQHNEAIIEMKHSMDELLSGLRSHTELFAACQDRLIATVPDGDYDGHRRYHEAVIRKMEARSKLWQDVSSSVAKWGAVGIFAWISIAIYHEAIAIFLKGIGKN